MTLSAFKCNSFSKKNFFPPRELNLVVLKYPIKKKFVILAEFLAGELALKDI